MVFYLKEPSWQQEEQSVVWADLNKSLEWKYNTVAERYDRYTVTVFVICQAAVKLVF